MTSPPCPPFAPSGPPRGLNFSRLTEAQPCPPFPAVTCSLTWSTNVAMAASLRVGKTKTREAGRDVRPGPPQESWLVLSHRGDDRRDAAAAQGAELDLARREGEQGVVLAAAHVQAGVEVG